MIVKKILVLSGMLIAAVSALHAQNVKPIFRHLVLSSYEITSEGTKEQVSIIDLLDINADGLVHLKEKYYKGVSDTTYHITDDLMNKLNAIFDGSKKLTTYMVMNKLPEGRHFAGALQYL